jgi:hypothetical protein
MLACALPALAGAGQQAGDVAPIPIGSASLSGRVMSADESTTPVRRAIVTLAGSGLGIDRSVVTDEAGHFSFDRLPAGSFTVTASKAAYLTAAYGATRPGRAGTPIAVAAGQPITGITVALARAGVIAGTIRGADGGPISGLQLLALRNGSPPPQLGLPGLAPPNATVTDDRGEYRIYGLTPGTYSVVALVTSSQLAEMHRRSTADVDAAFREAQQKGVAPTSPPVPPPIFTVAPIYYPGTAVAADAGHVDVSVGSVREDVSFSAEPVPSAAIDGLVERPAGATGRLTLLMSGADGALPLSFTMAPRLVMPPGPDGKFRYVNVAPGRYTITALITDAGPASPAAPPGSAGGSSVSGPVSASSPVWWATSEVTVAGEDLSGLSLTLQPGMSFAGRVIFDARTHPAPKDLTTIRVSLDAPTNLGTASINGTTFGSPQRAAFTRLEADGTFEISGVTPGLYRVNVTAPGTTNLSGFWLRSAMTDDRDALDTLVTMSPGQSVAHAVVTLTDRHTEIAGALETPQGQPASAYFVVVLPTDSALWRPGTRRVQSTRPATDGRYAFADLPPGTYVLAAVADLEPTDLADASFLQAIAGAGVSVTLGEGETRRQDLRLR